MGLIRQLKRPKVLFPLITALLIITALVMAIRTLNSPAEGTVTTQVADTAAGQPKSQPAYKTYSDAIVTFNYPGIYSAAAGQKSTGYLDSIELRKTQQRTEFANIGVYPGTLANESGISYRRGHPELYKPVTTGDGTIVYSKNDSTEYTGFLQKGNDIVTISFTAVGAHDFTDDYKMVADSLQLKQ
jgi:hypothetical protein